MVPFTGRSFVTGGPRHGAGATTRVPSVGDRISATIDAIVRHMNP
jgi:hypothetical protein